MNETSRNVVSVFSADKLTYDASMIFVDFHCLLQHFSVIIKAITAREIDSMTILCFASASRSVTN